MKWSLGFSILALVWSIYYLAMHKTGGILTVTDILVSGSVILVCSATIVLHIYRHMKHK